MDEWHNVCAPARLPWGVLRAGPAVDQSIAQSVLWLGIGELLGQSVSGQSVSGQSVSGQSVSGQSVSGQSVSGQSVSGQSVSGQSVSGQSVSGQSVSGQSVSGQSVSGQSVSGQSVSGQSVSGQSVSGQFTSCEFLAQIPALRENCFLILGLGRCPWYYRGRTWPRFLFFQVFWGVDSLWVRLASGKILLDSWGRFQRPVSSSGKILPLSLN